MPAPFPGMHPYLEEPALGSDVHTSLIAAVRDALASLVAPRFALAEGPGECSPRRETEGAANSYGRD